jgi:cytochrome b subunit of formate dehydrogenase
VLWVVVFLVLALAGLVMLVGYAVWLAHKTADVLSELRVLGRYSGQLAEMLAEIRVPGSPSSRQEPPNPLIVRAADVR